MSLLSMLTQTVTVGRRPFDTAGSQGIPTPGTTVWSERPGRLEQTDITEVAREWDVVLSEWRLFLTPDDPLDVLDLAVVDGLTYEAVAPAVIHHTPRGPHHQVVRLTRRTPTRPRAAEGGS